MTLLVAALRLLVMALVGQVSLVGDRGLATRFGDPDDSMDGDHLKCTHQKMASGQLACAHRTLPCGTLVMVHNPRTQRFAVCQVLDRGPFGAILPSGDWGLKLHSSEPGDWRGVIDLSPAVAEALDFNGREKVHIFYQQVAHHLRAGRTPPR